MKTPSGRRIIFAFFITICIFIISIFLVPPILTSLTLRFGEHAMFRLLWQVSLLINTITVLFLFRHIQLYKQTALWILVLTPSLLLALGNILELTELSIMPGNSIEYHASEIIEFSISLSLLTGLIFTAPLFGKLQSSLVALQQNEIKHRVMLSKISDVIAIIDSHGTVKYASENVEHHFGWKPQQLVGHPFSDALHPDDVNTFHREILELQNNNNSTMSGEYQYHTSDGGYKLIRHYAVNLIHEPSIEGILINYHDITEQNKNKKLLDEDEMFLHSILDSTNDGILAVSNNGKILKFNDRFLHQWQIPAAIIDGNDEETLFAYVLHQLVDPQLFLDRVQDLYKSERTFFDVLLFKDGRTFERHSTPLILNSNVIGWVWSFRDITERVKAEMDLRDSEEQFRAMSESAIDAIVTSDINGNIIGWNRAAEKEFGYTSAEIIGQPLEIIMPFDYRERHHRGMMRIRNGGDRHIIGSKRELIGLHKNGTSFPIELSLTEWKSSKGVFFTGTIHDITVRKTAEKELRTSEEKFGKAFAISPSAISITSAADGKYIDVNDEFLRKTGYSREEIIGHSAVDLNFWVELKNRNEYLLQLRNAGSVQRFEADYRMKSGEVRNFSVSSIFLTLEHEECILHYIDDITERKKAEKKIFESELQLKKAQHFARVGSWTWNINLNQLDWSDEMFNIFGLQKETFSGSVGEVIAQSIHPEDRAKVDQSNLSVVQLGKPVPLEYRIIWPDNSVHTVWAEAGELVLDEFGKPAILTGIVQDITERKKSEEKLRQLSRAVEQSPVSIVITDTTGAIEYANPKFVEITGYTLDEAKGKNPRILQSGYTSSLEYKELWNNLTSGEEWRGEFYNRKKNGDLYWEFATISPIIDDHGVITHYLAVKEDITERKQVEQKLQESEKKYRNLVHTMQQGLAVHEIICDDTGNPVDYRFLDINERFEEITGLRGRDIIGKTVREVLPNIEHEWIETYGKVALTGESAYFENFSKDLDRHYSCSVYQPEPKKFAVIINDITDLKKTQHEIQELNSHLEQRVTDRTRELEDTNKQLESFSYSISHDLRTPLRAIDSFAKYLIEEENERLSVNGIKYTSVIRDSTKTMNKLIEDILEFSRIGHKEINKTLIDIDFSVREILNQLTGLEFNRTFESTILPLPKAYGDPALINQVLLNLIGNAMKFSKNREVSIIEMGSRETSNEIIYYIKDNGSGFDMRYVDKLFGMFQRLHSNEEFEGSGVGLAIVHRIIQRHGGRVWAESVLDKGATFYFSIPKKDSIVYINRN